MPESGTENQVISIQVDNDHIEDISSTDKKDGGNERCFVEWLWSQDIWFTYHRHVPMPLAFSTTCLLFSFIFMLIMFLNPKHANDTGSILLGLTSGYGLFALVPLTIFTSYKALKAIFQCLLHCDRLSGVRLWILADIVIEVLQCMSFALLLKYSDNPKTITPGGLILVGISSGISTTYTIVIFKILLHYNNIFGDSLRRDEKLDTLRMTFKTIVSSINQLYRDLATANRIVEEEMVWAGAKEIVNAEEEMKNNKYKEELALIRSRFSDISRRIAEARRVAARV